jgi:hypothetical protein
MPGPSSDGCVLLRIDVEEEEMQIEFEEGVFVGGALFGG